MRFFHLLWLFILWLNMDKSLQQNEVTCPNQKHQDVHYWNVYWRQRITLGDTASYWCRSGYKKTDGADKLTCTRDGWSPNPPCQEIKCDGMVFENAVISNNYEQEYRENGKAYYVCRGGQSRFTLTCTANGWVGQNTCEAISKPCEAPPRVENAVVRGAYQKEYSSGSTVTYLCRQKYTMEGEGMITCTNGHWDKVDINCTLHCHKPEDETDTMRVTEDKERYVHDDVIEYRCISPSEKAGSATCVNGEWDKPVTCKDTCTVTDVLGKAKLHKYVEGAQLREGEKLRFYCNLRGHTLQGKEEVECLADGQWSGPFPTCGVPAGCERPPVLANGDTTTSVKPRYEHNERVEYICQRYYIMEGEPYQTCNNGEWTGEMKCLKPCTVDKELLETHNLEFIHISADKVYSAHDDVIGFQCVRGTTHDGRVGMRQKCNDGVMDLPTCH